MFSSTTLEGNYPSTILLSTYSKPILEKRASKLSITSYTYTTTKLYAKLPTSLSLFSNLYSYSYSKGIGLSSTSIDLSYAKVNTKLGASFLV